MLDKTLLLDIPDGICLSTSDPLVFEKQVIYVGQFDKRNPQTNELEYSFSVDEETIDHWIKTHQALLSAGLDVPMPKGHTESEPRKATALSYSKRQDSKGRTSLFARLKFKDLECAKEFKDSQVSLYSPPVYYHQKQAFIRPIRHIAFTDYPVIGDLDPLTTIAASYSSGVKPMSFKAIAQKLGVTVDEKATEEQAEAAITAAWAAKGAAPATPATVVPPTTSAVAASVASPATPARDPLLIKTAVENRQLKIDALVAARKMLPAEAKAMKDSWATETVSLSTENVSAFDMVLKTFNDREPIVALGQEKSGAQQKQVEESPLVKDAKARAAQAAQN